MISPRFLLSTYTFITVMAVVLLTGNSENSLSSPPSYILDKTYKITLLQTNDVELEKFHSSNSLAMTERKAMIDQVRLEVEANGSKVILLSGGDISASVENAKTSNINKLNYTAMTVSQHQFDFPLETIRQQQHNARFPMISANIFESETGKPLFDAYRLINMDGLNIAVLGLTEATSPKAPHSENLKGIDIINPVEIASELAPMLKKQADIVIASTHIGHNASSEYYRSRTPLSSIDEIDLIVGDHTEDQKTNGSHSECGWFLTRIDLEFINGELTVVNSEKLALDSPDS